MAEGGEASMILHPDGRIEGTPEEIARLEAIRRAELHKQIEYRLKHPSVLPWWLNPDMQIFTGGTLNVDGNLKNVMVWNSSESGVN